MQPLSSTKSLLCRELVGRENELQDLRETMQRAAMGRPQMMLLAGEAGLGKTKLCRYFMKESRAQHTRVLFGQAILQDQALPFGPFLDAFRRYFTSLYRTLAPSQVAQHPSLSSLPQLFPALASLFPELSPSLTPDGTTVQSQQVVFHCILSALQELERSTQGSLLLVLEDLHWADETSLELLAFLAQRFGMNANTATLTPVDQSTAIMILVTYRVEALSDNPALSRLLLQLHIQRQASEIKLTPLSSTEHWHCLSTILGQPVTEEFADFLFEWDEGNPFFTEELLGAMAASGQLQMQSQAWLNPTTMKPRLPSSLTDAILERFVRLPAADQEILAYAAVIGRAFDFPLLAALSGLNERELLGVLRRAMNAQLISEVNMTQPESLPFHEHERYQFRHTLTREAMYDQMLAPERHMRHRMVAETIEELIHTTPTSASNATPLLLPDNVDRLLAEHYWQAGLPDKAGPYALHEAERARRVFAFREERYYLNMAQESLLEDSSERFQLLERIGMVSMAVYDFSGTLHWLSMAKAGYQRIGQPYQARKVMANMLLPSWFLAKSSLPDMLTELETAAEEAFVHPDQVNLSVETLVIISLIATYQTIYECQFRRALRWIERGVTLYESQTDPRKDAAIQLSYLSHGWIKANQQATIAEEGIAEIRGVLKVALRYNLPDVILFSYAWLAWVLISWGRGDEAEQVLAEATEFETRSGVLSPLFIVGWQRFFSGERWEQGIELLRAGMKQMELANVPAILAIEGLALVHLLLARNELDEAQGYLQTIQATLEVLDQYIYIVQLWWGVAKLQTARGEHLQAQAYYERILNRWKTTEDTLVIPPILLDGIIFYAETGELVKARQWLTELHDLVHATDNPVCAAALLEAQGTMYIKEGKIEQAMQALRQAVEAWGKLKRRYQQALASQCLAGLLLTWAKKYSINRSLVQAAREEAEHLLEDALLVYERLQIPTGKAAVQALRTSTRLDSQQKRRSTLEEKRQPVQGLTQRELQVLIQLAAGKMNKEIATALSLSVGTVELHVSHILTKLGCDTRTQAATYAITQGWVKK